MLSGPIYKVRRIGSYLSSFSNIYLDSLRFTISSKGAGGRVIYRPGFVACSTVPGQEELG